MLKWKCKPQLVYDAWGNVVDATGTAIVWFEASVLIAVADSIFTNIGSVSATNDNSSIRKSGSTLR